MNQSSFMSCAGAMLALCAQCLVVLMPVSRPLRAKPATTPVKGKGTSYALYEKSRVLLLLPLEGDPKSRFAYLNKGVRRILASRLRSFGYMYVQHPRREFFFKTGKNSDRVKGGKHEGKSGPARVALRVKVLETDEENYKALKLYDAPVLARRFNASYTLRGNIVSDGANPRLALRLYDARANRTRSFSYDLNADKPYTGMTAAALEIFSAISIRKPVTVSVQTAKPGAMAYLDSVYLGRTPLEYKIVPGKYRLRVEQNGHAGYSRNVRVDSAGASFRVANRVLAATAGLSVASKPPGARVFLNDRYLGKTPLKRKDLPPGTHRLRVAREKHVDRFLGIVLRNDKLRGVSVKLSPGDTRTVFRDPGHVILNWTYDDLSFYSWISALGFYAGFGFFRVRADRIAATVRAEVPLFLGINEFGTITSVGISGFLSNLTAYQLWKSEQNLGDVRKLRRRADVSGGLGVLSLLAGGLFLYLGLENEAREVGEVGYFLAPTPILYGETREHEAGISAGLRIRF